MKLFTKLRSLQAAKPRENATQDKPWTLAELREHARKRALHQDIIDGPGQPIGKLTSRQLNERLKANFIDAKHR